MMNRIELIGNVGRPPERSKDNAPVKFSIATTERYKDKSGQQVKNTTWHNVIAWGKLGDIILKYVTKGKQIFIAGRYESNEYEKEGVKHKSYYVVASEMHMLGSKPSGSDGQQSSNEQAAQAVGDADVVDEIDLEDIPF